MKNKTSLRLSGLAPLRFNNAFDDVLTRRITLKF